MEAASPQAEDQEREREALIDALLDELTVTDNSYEAAQKTREVYRLVTGGKLADAAALTSAEKSSSEKVDAAGHTWRTSYAIFFTAGLTISTALYIQNTVVNWDQMSIFTRGLNILNMVLSGSCIAYAYRVRAKLW